MRPSPNPTQPPPLVLVNSDYSTDLDPLVPVHVQFSERLKECRVAERYSQSPVQSDVRKRKRCLLTLWIMLLTL